MSQEVNPYLVTSIISATRMPEDYTQNSMKEKYKQRIMDEEKAYLKKSTSLKMPRSRNFAVSENTVKGKHSAHHRRHQKDMYGGQ